MNSTTTQVRFAATAPRFDGNYDMWKYAYAKIMGRSKEL